MIPFIDGHNDVLLSLDREGGASDFLDGRPFGHLDLARAREGSLAGGFFAVFVDPEREPLDAAGLPGRELREPPYALPLAEPVGLEWSRQRAEMLTRLLNELIGRSNGAVALVENIDDLERSVAGGPLGAILHFEGAEPIQPDLENLVLLYEQGLRSIGIVWSRPNAFAEGVPFRFPSSPDTGPGLTDAGRQLVAACNELGIMIDLSHLNEQGFWDVARLSQAPLVASHSNAHALCAVSRNLTDAQLDEIGRSGGLVGITVHAGMLREDGRIDASTPIERVLEHVEHVAGRIGIDHVAFGSDFDGAVVIEEIGDAAGLPRLADALRERGYADTDVAKFAHANWLRVLRATWR